MGRPIKAHRIWRPVNRSNRETTFKLSDFLVKTPVTGQTGPVNRSNRPINRSNRETTFKPSDFLVKTPVTSQTGPVNRSELITHVLLNLDLNSTDFHQFLV